MPSLEMVPDSVYRGDLTQNALSSLVNDEILAIMVPEFASDEYLQEARSLYARKPLEQYQYFDQTTGVYKNLGVRRYGLPYNTTYAGDDAALDNYYAQVPGSMWEMRGETSPYLHPIDHLRLLLDEIWPEGAGVASHNGKKNFVGIYREVSGADSASGEVPHFDALPAHKGDTTQQFAANIYVDLPDQGGELLVWPTKQIRREDLKDYQESRAFQELVASPPIKIAPEIGMLILFNTQKPHAVAGFEGEKRSSLQCFIGLEQDSRLSLWN